jgi:predicted metal-dependent peptidase
LLREVNPKRVHIVYCDTQIQLTITYEPDDYESIQLHYPGRGGTRCRPVFNWVEEQDFNPVCMIYFSDMEINDWGEEPEYPVLWAATDRRGHAPWGEQIQLDEV